MYSRLKKLAEKHEFIGCKIYNEFPSEVTPVDHHSVFTSRNLVYSPMTPKQSSETIERQVSKLLTQKNFKFEGVMINNGAANSPAGIHAFIRYCAHTGKIPRIYPSNRSFRGIAHSINRSLGFTPIRLPIGPTLTLDFNAELVDQDVPIKFGLENHKYHRCSTDKVEDTFTHRPMNTTVPLTFREDAPGQGGLLFFQWPISEVL